MPITIEKGIPVPCKKGAWNAALTMDVGDSFFVPSATDQTRHTVWVFFRRHGMALMTRKVVGGIRFWRTE